MTGAGAARAGAVAVGVAALSVLALAVLRPGAEPGTAAGTSAAAPGCGSCDARHQRLGAARAVLAEDVR